MFYLKLFSSGRTVVFKLMWINKNVIIRSIGGFQTHKFTDKQRETKWDRIITLPPPCFTVVERHLTKTVKKSTNLKSFSKLFQTIYICFKSSTVIIPKMNIITCRFFSLSWPYKVIELLIWTLKSFQIKNKWGK